MYKSIVLIFFSIIFVQELEVDGTLKVTGGIDVQGQTISNVGNPVNANDAIPMSAVSGVVTNAMSLAGMNPPERIYSKIQVSNENAWFTVPENKIWIINLIYRSITIYNSQGQYMNNIDSGYGDMSFTLLSGYQIEANTTSIFTIYEYSITSSGTSQGLDYVEP